MEDEKHDADYRRQWRKVHLRIDASTLDIRAMEVTDNSIGDAPVLPALLGQIPADERIAGVSGDGVYDTKDCHEAIALREAHAIIPTERAPNPGRPIAAARTPAPRFCTRHAGWAGRSGKNGAATTGAALSKPKCAALSCWANASWHVILTVKSPSYRYELPC